MPIGVKLIFLTCLLHFISTNLVFFGAGASYGCRGVQPYQPPLGDKLFKKLKEDYPNSWGRLPEYLHLHFEGNFELGMEMVVEFHLETVTELMRDMNHFFLQFEV